MHVSFPLKSTLTFANPTSFSVGTCRDADEIKGSANGPKSLPGSTLRGVFMQLAADIPACFRGLQVCK